MKLSDKPYIIGFGDSISLWQELGFAGSSYTMQVGDRYFTLLDALMSNKIDSSDREVNARSKAKEIIDREFPDMNISLDDIPFKYNGHM